MKSKELFRLNIGLQSLAIFRNLLKDPVCGEILAKYGITGE